MNFRERLRQYVEEDKIYQEWLDENTSYVSDFDSFCIQHCRDIENILEENARLKEENKRLKQWDRNKDSRNSRQRTTNAELHKRIHLLNQMNEKNYNNYCEMINRWSKLKEWIKDYQISLEMDSDSAEGLDLFQEHILIILDDISFIMKDLEGNND